MTDDSPHPHSYQKDLTPHSALAGYAAESMDKTLSIALATETELSRCVNQKFQHQAVVTDEERDAYVASLLDPYYVRRTLFADLPDCCWCLVGMTNRSYWIMWKNHDTFYGVYPAKIIHLYDVSASNIYEKSIWVFTDGIFRLPTKQDLTHHQTED